MRRIFTRASVLAALFVFSNQVSGQLCTTPATFTPASTNTFAGTAEGFTGDFIYSNGGGGQLQSSSGATRTLISTTYFVPNNASTIAFSYSLSGAADISGYTVTALYNNNGTITPITLCTGGVITNGTVGFAAQVPNELLGKNIKIQITYTFSGNTSQVKNIDNFSTNIGASAIALPVRFSGLNASVQSNGNVGLIWRVDAEENLAGYSVERSSDGVRYASIGYIAAAGQSRYSFTDAAPIANAFYRIKSVDVDGKAGYSTIVNVKGDATAIVIRGYFNSGNTIMVQHDEAQTGARITVTSADGRLVRSVVPQAGSQQTTVGLPEAATGLYIVRYDAANGQSGTFKLVKQ